LEQSQAGLSRDWLWSRAQPVWSRARPDRGCFLPIPPLPMALIMCSFSSVLASAGGTIVGHFPRLPGAVCSALQPEEVRRCGDVNLRRPTRPKRRGDRRGGAGPGRTGVARKRVDAAVDIGSQQRQRYCPECGQVVARFRDRVCYHSRWDYDRGHTAWCDGSDPGMWGLEDEANDGP
jgi:hypothetical protein